jgi:serine protease Do
VGKEVPVVVIRKSKKETLVIEIGRLEEDKKAEEKQRPEHELGMITEELTPQLARNLGLSETKGLVVVHIENNSPADEAGVRSGDVLLEIDQAPIKGLDDFHKKIKTYKEGDTILLLIKRGGATLYLTLRVPAQTSD